KSRNRCTKAATHWLQAEGVVVPKNPMVGSFPACCAPAPSGHAAAPPSSVMNSRRFMGGGPHVGGRTIPRRCLKKLRCIAAKLNIEWQRWVIASDGDAPNAHRSGERVAFHDNQYRVFPGLVAHSVNATRALSVISRMCGILLRPGSS